jgi:hypothetical protein
MLTKKAYRKICRLFILSKAGTNPITSSLQEREQELVQKTWEPVPEPEQSLQVRALQELFPLFSYNQLRMPER